jgi:hypothetical protein
MFLASTASVVTQHCLYTDYFGCVRELCCIHSCVLGCMCVAVRCGLLQYVAVCCIHCRVLGCIQVPPLRHGILGMTVYLDASVYATHCNTLQHSATQRTATLYNTAHFNNLQTHFSPYMGYRVFQSVHTAALCNILQHTDRLMSYMAYRSPMPESHESWCCRVHLS